MCFSLLRRQRTCDLRCAVESQSTKLGSASEQTRLRRGSTKRRHCGCFVFALLIETQPFAVDLKETFGRFPVLTFTPHPFTKLTRVQFSISCFPNTIQNAICTGR